MSKQESTIEFERSTVPLVCSAITCWSSASVGGCCAPSLGHCNDAVLASATALVDGTEAKRVLALASLDLLLAASLFSVCSHAMHLPTGYALPQAAVAAGNTSLPVYENYVSAGAGDVDTAGISRHNYQPVLRAQSLARGPLTQSRRTRAATIQRRANYMQPFVQISIHATLAVFSVASASIVGLDRSRRHGARTCRDRILWLGCVARVTLGKWVTSLWLCGLCDRHSNSLGCGHWGCCWRREYLRHMGGGRSTVATTVSAPPRTRATTAQAWPKLYLPARCAGDSFPCSGCGWQQVERGTVGALGPWSRRSPAACNADRCRWALLRGPAQTDTEQDSEQQDERNCNHNRDDDKCVIGATIHILSGRAGTCVSK